MKSIEEELADCRTAWTANPAVKFSWCCHHKVLVEPIGNPEERIAYILSDKPQDEQAVRFRNFRPVRVKLPAKVEKASAERDKARTEYHKAGTEYHKAVTEYDKASADRDKAWAEYEKAQAEYENAFNEYEKARADREKTWAVHQEELERLHREDWPDTTWNGRSIFAK